MNPIFLGRTFMFLFMVSSKTDALRLGKQPKIERALEVALREWSDEVRHAADTASADSVVVTMTNQKYRDRFDEVLNSFGKMAGAPLAVVALDEETERFFRGRGVPCFWLNPQKFGLSHWHWPGYPLKESVMRGKFEVTTYLLEAGLQVVFTEMDIYWKRNPLTLLNVFAVDFLVAQHNYDPNGEINIGFYIAKPTPTVKRTFNKVRDWIAQQDRYDEFEWCGCMDQKILDFAVRGSGQCHLVSRCHFPRGEQAKLFDTASSNLNWAYIPYSLLPHWPLPKDVEHDDRVVAVHVWSGAGPPSFQMHWAQQHGFWDSGSRVPILINISAAKTADGYVCGCDDFTF